MPSLGSGRSVPIALPELDERPLRAPALTSEVSRRPCQDLHRAQSRHLADWPGLAGVAFQYVWIASGHHHASVGVVVGAEHRYGQFVLAVEPQIFGEGRPALHHPRRHSSEANAGY